jgi:hypothetical protein
VNAHRAVAAAAGYAPPPDTTPPAVRIDAPAADSTVAGTIQVDVTATDGTGVTQVSLSLDGTLLASDPAAPYRFTWDTTAFGNGTHTLVAKATDPAGNVGSSTAVTVTVKNVTDSAPPTAAITSTSTVKNRLMVRVDAQDDVGVVKVELYLDGRLKATATAAPYDFTVNIRNLPKGSHALEARAHDAAGKVGVSSPTSFTK